MYIMTIISFIACSLVGYTLIALQMESLKESIFLRLHCSRPFRWLEINFQIKISIGTILPNKAGKTRDHYRPSHAKCSLDSHKLIMFLFNLLQIRAYLYQVFWMLELMGRKHGMKYIQQWLYRKVEQSGLV